MKIGEMVKSKTRGLVSCSSNYETMLKYATNNMLSVKEDTVELINHKDVFGMVIKIDKGLSGCGSTIVQVLLKNKLKWFLFKDLIKVTNPIDKNQFKI